MRILITFMLLLTVAGCETVATTQPGTVGVERQQTMMVSSQEIDKAAGVNIVAAVKHE